MIVKDSGVDRCRSVVWAADPRMWGAFVADSDSETTYVGEKLGEHGIGVVVEVVAYSLWIKGIGGKEGWVTGCDQGKARGGIGARAVVLSGEGYSLWTEGIRVKGWITWCDQGGVRRGIGLWAAVLFCGEE